MARHLRQKMLRRGTSAIIACMLSGVFLFGSVTPAQACAAEIFRTVGLAATKNWWDIYWMTTQVSRAFGNLIDAITRLANQSTNNTQNHVDALGIISDKDATQMSASTTAKIRAAATADFMPSRSVCQGATAQGLVVAANATMISSRAATQNTFREFSNNIAGGSEKGSLGALNTRFQIRCSKYANPSVVRAPSVCPGTTDPEMQDLDIRPWDALIDPITFRTTQHRDAAIDAVFMLTDISPPDPLKGPALSRVDGQNLHILRMRDVTRMHLARGVLEDMVAIRTDTGSGVSRLGRYIELVTGQKIDPATGKLSDIVQSSTVAGEMENAAVSTLITRLATQQALLFEIMRVTEQMLAIEAVELAIKIESGRGGNPRLAGRVIQ